MHYDKMSFSNLFNVIFSGIARACRDESKELSKMMHANQISMQDFLELEQKVTVIETTKDSYCKTIFIPIILGTTEEGKEDVKYLKLGDVVQYTNDLRRAREGFASSVSPIFNTTTWDEEQNNQLENIRRLMNIVNPIVTRVETELIMEKLST